ncbi:MAG: amino acid adenylation domain-containing protein [Bacteroidetes bacterium]|nr:amino acid adenylation domain-containing protein [Bacteroidota bacterium]
MNKEDTHKILVEWNETTTLFPQNLCIHNLFEIQAKKNPEKVAVTCAGESLTYDQLDKKSNSLANYLKRHGVVTNVFVGICVERSLEMIVGILGILKAGGVYVPLDPEYPADRLAFMLNDCGASVLLTLRRMSVELPEINISTIYLDADWDNIRCESEHFDDSSVTSDNLIYVIYTSGSTGRPKGTLIYHKGFVNLLHWYTTEFFFGADAKVLLISSTSFDLTQKNIFAPLICGGHLVLLESQVFDAGIIQDTIERHGVTSLNCTPSAFQGLVLDGDEFCYLKLKTLRQVFLGGEPIIVSRFESWRKNPHCEAQIINSYGPTECTDVCAYYRLIDYERYNETSVPIGRPICNTQLYVLDSDLKLMPIGEEGELCIGGAGVGAGYLNRSDLTSEKFIPNPFGTNKSDRLYRTGDRTRYLVDGNIEYLGRIDQQVKIRGFRIELGEIESAIDKHPAVRESVVISSENSSGQKYLVAYIVISSDKSPIINEIRRFLQKTLPDYMLPTAWMFIDKMPLTPNGKVDRLKLPAVGNKRPEISQEYRAPLNELEKQLADIWCEILGFDKVGVNDPFFELGGTSIQAIQFISRVGRLLSHSIPIVNFFDAPTISFFSSHLLKFYTNQVIELFPSLSLLEGQISPEYRLNCTNKCCESKNPDKLSFMNNNLKIDDDIAIIGMAGRFPGSSDVGEFWDNLCKGKELSTRVSEKDLLDSGLDPLLLDNPSYVNVCYALDAYDMFDASFFGYTPKEAEIIDPQHRLFLECAWSVLEDSGYDLSTCNAKVGIFGGVARNGYLINNIGSHDDLRPASGEYQYLLGNEKDFVTTRVAYKLNLRGLALSVQTACSSSGVALHLACQSLKAGDCDMAIVGGCRVEVPHNVGYQYIDGGTFSEDGHIRTFDAKSSGMVRGSGGGCILLKRMKSAVADNDNVHVVIKSSAVNNDGSDKIGFSAPSVRGQAEVITKALSVSGIDPETVQYVESHGTGTRLGDPIEIAALTQAYRNFTDKNSFCAIGSVKTNIGHLDAGACIAGVIKTALSIKYKKIPPSLHYENPNPNIDFVNSPFYVNAELQEWPANGVPRRAGISSFGMGGTNAHIIIEEADIYSESSASRPWNVVMLSARTEISLDKAISNLLSFLKKNSAVNFSDMAYTLQIGRRNFEHRACAVCRSVDDLIFSSDGNSRFQRRILHENGRVPKVVFMFPGQGSQHVNMGRDLYENEPEFKNTVDYCAGHFNNLLNIDLIGILYPEPDKAELSSKLLLDTQITQAALFTVEFALSKLWMSWGVKPAVMIGHSIGEYVAACLSGVISLEDALETVALRGRLMQAMDKGSMIAVQMPAKKIQDILEPGTSVSVINAPDRCVVSGPENIIEILKNKLITKKIGVVQLQTSHAFHSEMMESAMAPFVEYLKRIRLNQVQIPFISCCTGQLITDKDATDPHYWSRQLRQPVLFSQGIQTIVSDENTVLLEVGPGNTLSSLSRRHIRKESLVKIITSWANVNSEHSAYGKTMSAVGELWLAKVVIDWHGFYHYENRRRISLPTYPFERKRFWINAALKSNNETPILPRDVKQMTINQNTATSHTVEYPSQNPSVSRKDRLVIELRNIIIDLSGLELNVSDGSTSFLDLGLDSIFLTQIIGELQKKFGIKVKFRQLFEEYTNIASLADLINKELPPDKMTPKELPIEQPRQQDFGDVVNKRQLPVNMDSLLVELIQSNDNPINPNSSVGLERVIAQQLLIMQQQLNAMRGLSADSGMVSSVHTVNRELSTQGNMVINSPPETPSSESIDKNDNQNVVSNKAFGAGVRIEKSHSMGMTGIQKKTLDTIISGYIAKTKGSKNYTELNRPHLADPRAVSGFSPLMKELVYPIVINRSFGSKVWDVDGNEYIDMTNGFGANLLGHSPPFITEALTEQLKLGVEIGPQHPLAGEVAQLVCEFSKLDRAIFCNTGSEAVMGAMRIARTVTGRDKIVMFTDDYHGMFDEIIVRGTKTLRSIPASAGIPFTSVEKMMVLEYGAQESIDIISENAKDIAAVLVEPVQSRNLDLQPAGFLKILRQETEKLGIALIFDEVVTGFRCHPNGAQVYFDVKADIVTYGKVVGGGMPIGVITGRSKFMDALDGGQWRYGDSSIPEAGVTYFAGTFVRHPLALAAARATLNYLKISGPLLQENLNKKTASCVASLRDFIRSVKAPIKILHFSSAFQLKFTEDILLPGLIYVFLRHKGIHISEGRTWFFTASHTDEDVDAVVTAFKESILDLQRGGFLSGNPEIGKFSVKDDDSERILSTKPPVPGAKLGRCPDGNPAWFVPDPNKPGKYLEVK